MHINSIIVIAKFKRHTRIL